MRDVFIRVLFCIFSLGMFLYIYINKQNSITELRLQIPQVAENLEKIRQENIRLTFEIDRFENPLSLMELARRPEFSHLRYPLLNEIITLPLKETETNLHKRIDKSDTLTEQSS